MKKLLFILIILLQACTDQPEGMFVMGGIDISVLDENGTDLLSPNSGSTKAIDVDKIQIYYIIDGKEVPYESVVPESTETYIQLSHPKGYYLLYPEGKYTNYRLGVFVDTQSKEDITKTIIQWDANHRDLIEAKVERDDNSVAATKFWLNGTLVDELNGEPLEIRR